MKKNGILITHGTDTLAWSHAFLRYAISGNHANIVLTGSQIPLPPMGDFSDAYINIGNSIRFITQLKPPNILTVFNFGRDAFSDSLHKINRWDNQAFTGDLVARMEWDEVKHCADGLQVSIPEKLDTLFLVTTGGTIESTYNDEGVLVPGENHLMGYISSKFSGFFHQIAQKPAFVIDSSDLNFERMKLLALKVQECLNEENAPSPAVCDLLFSDCVRIIYADPFKTIENYYQEAAGAEALVIAGYGGGNLTIDEQTGRSLLSLVNDMVSNDIPVVLTSQVPLGPADFIYKNAWEVIKAGAISAVDLSIPEIQVRLSYMMGHKHELRAATNSREGYMALIDKLFTSGMKFRTTKSRRMYESLKGFQVNAEDLLVGVPFHQALMAVT